MALSPKDKLGTAIIRVCGIGSSNPTPQQAGVAPYFGTLLRGLVRRETPGVGTMAVTHDGILLWDPAFVDKESQEVIVFALVHESMHVALKHFDRALTMGIKPEPTAEDGDAALANWAQDACINEQALKAGLKVPSWALTPQQPCPAWFDAPAQPPGLIWEQRYQLLKAHRPQSRKQRQQQQGMPGQGTGNDKKDGGGQGQGKPQTGAGWCGSCAAHPVPQESPITKPDPDGRSAADMERMRKATADAVTEHVMKNRGDVPDDLIRWAAEYLAPPVIPWREKLARILRGAVAYKSGAVDYTYTKISRRQAGIGFGVGRPVVPALHAPIPDVAVGIDTSGSMSEQDLADAASEVQGILSAIGGSVTVGVCDAAMHGLKKVRDIKEAVGMLKGGGGTDMTPIFDELEKRKPRAAVTVILTDGHIGNGYPKREPKWTKTIWVVVGAGGNPNPCPWGDVIVARDVAVGKKAA